MDSESLAILVMALLVVLSFVGGWCVREFVVPFGLAFFRLALEFYPDFPIQTSHTHNYSINQRSFFGPRPPIRRLPIHPRVHAPSLELDPNHLGTDAS